MMRTFIRKNIEVLSPQDLIAIREHLNTLSAWPWTPKFVTEIRKANDLEFTARSPEVVEKFCNWVYFLYDKIKAITFSYDITLCKHCKYWTEEPEIQSQGVVFGKCVEMHNVNNFAAVGAKSFLTPTSYGCIHGEKIANKVE